MQNFKTHSKPSKKLLVPMSTRVPVEVQELVDELVGSHERGRAKWIRRP